MLLCHRQIIGFIRETCFRYTREAARMRNTQEYYAGEVGTQESN